MTIEQLYEIYKQFSSIQTDTRKLKEGDLFFALKGPNFNGNEFAIRALEAGAAYSIVDEKPIEPNDRLIQVPDVLKALQDLALYHRKQFNIPFIAITGSNGKTTTKELVHVVLSSRYQTYTTEGNLNNHIGVPVTLLKIRSGAEMAVIEMGANHLGEIASYCSYTLPTHGIITNCGKAHLEGFGSVEGVRKGKGELFDFLRTNMGTAFIMNDYDYLIEMSQGIREIIKYGTSNADVTGTIARAEPFLQVNISGKAGKFQVDTKLVGDYNLPNVLVAVAVGNYFNIDSDTIKNSIEAYVPSNSRSQLIQKNGNTIILDAYNANPSSMKAAIENFALMHAAEKILILGAMAELGHDSIREHELIVEVIERHQWKDVVLVGGDFLNIPHPFTRLKDSTEAAKWVQHHSLRHAHILVKGSRSMQMEKVLENL